MSSSITIMQSLCSLANSSLYCPPITLNSKMEFFHDFKCEYEPLSNNIQIIPPSVWFGIEQTKCLANIRNDVERSRVTRQGLLSTNLKGNMLNKINYQQYEEDLGTIQETQQCFCVAFAIVKDSCEDFLKQIGSELRSCLVQKSSLIDRSHMKVSQLDELSKQIYSKYRIFLIFDTKSQPGRLLSIHSCFYPNVRFTIQRIKKKQGLKFRVNQVLQQIQRGQIINTFGYLSLDSKMTLLMIKKDDPELVQDNLVGVWVISSFSANRTKKQFGKEDGIWLALLEYYTNPQVKKKLSIISNQKGILCYFGFKKQRSKLDSPEYYLFQPSIKSVPKWSFLTKSQFVSDLSKSCQIKVDFLDNTIFEERQYSQFSDQPNIENISRQNSTKQQSKSKNNISNDSGFSQSSQNQAKNTNLPIKNADQQNEKTKIISELRAQLQKYKQKCIQLQAMNKILMQQKVANQMMMANQFQIMPHTAPIYQYGQIQPNFPYPLSYSQVVPVNAYQGAPVGPVEQKRNPAFVPQNSNIISNGNQVSVKLQQDANGKFTQKRQKSQIQAAQNQKKISFSFPEPKQQEITFRVQEEEIKRATQKLFIKKSHSHGFQMQKKHQNSQQLNYNLEEEPVRQHHVRKDLRNISFQDSFAQYHSQGQDEGPTFSLKVDDRNGKIVKRQLDRIKNGQFDSSRKQNRFKQQQKQTDNLKSPQFKRVQSLQTQAKKLQQFNQQNKKIKSISIQQRSRQAEQNMKQLMRSNIKQQEVRRKQQIKTNDQIIEIDNKNKPYKEQKSPILLKYGKKTVELSSNESEQQKKKKTKVEDKKQLKVQKQALKKPEIKKKIADSDSGDSDEDIELKNIRRNYLKR